MRLMECFFDQLALLALILGVTKGEDEEEDGAEQPEADAKGSTLAEVFRHAEVGKQCDDEVHEGNDEQDDSPARFATDAKPDDGVVNGDEERPARLSGLGEDFPEGDDHQDDDGQGDQRGDGSELPLGGVFE
jgi:hypothetical protein